ncbi:substrate-binding domain-containing protein [Pontiellaceae bacterium B1224]|nr:substrate-binding domain-containing protein [Pontiellaceae bacterium B1224]
MLSALSNYRLENHEKIKNATLAWINPFKNPAQLRAQREFKLYWEGALQAAAHFGFHVEEFTTSALSLKRMDTIFKTRNIQGIILASLGGGNMTGGWDTFPWKDYMTVRFGLSTSYPEAHRITSAQVRNAYLAFNKMHEKGYQRIGFCGHRSPTRMFAAGFTFAQYSLPKSRQLPPLFSKVDNDDPGNTSDTEIRDVKNWINRYKPDAILTERPPLLHVLNDLGYNIPSDIGLATLSIHDTPLNAGIDQNPEEIGRAAVRTLVSQLTEQHFGIPAIQKETLIDGKWIDGSMLPKRC